jgi:diaminopimelate epimerase
MRFAKYQGIGNDFVMLADPRDELELTPRLVRALSDRHFGIGADGVIRVAPGVDGADLSMDYVNSDGSIGEMCGNGIRCLALFALQEGMTDATHMQVATPAGLMTIEVGDNGRVRVDMGAPIFEPAAIPIRWEGPEALHTKLEVDGEVVEATCLSMGNPHAVLFVDDPERAPVTTLGPRLETHEAFPNRANIEFVRVVTPQRVEMRVWERGVGETLACGTGACAAAVASRLIGGADAEMVVSLPGGELEIEWEGSLRDAKPVFMTGPAVRSFEGEVDLEGMGL